MTGGFAGWVKEYLGHRRALGTAPSTLAAYALVLGRFARHAAGRGIKDPSEITPEHLAAFLSRDASHPSRRKAGEGLSPHTVRREYDVLKGFSGYLVKRGAVLRDEVAALEMGKLRQTFRRPPSRGALAALLAAPGDDRFGLRDRAVFETFFSTGLRRAELCALNLEDLDRTSGIVRVNRGKGGKDRLVPIGKTALDAVALYLLKARPEFHPRGPALFVNMYGERVKPAVIYSLFCRYSRKLNLDPPITPHLLRHAFATGLLENGADVRHVQAMLGHAQVQTTEIYTHVSARHLKEEIERFHPRARLEG